MYNVDGSDMFCPQCGTLSYPSPSGDITCTNYKSDYTGPANVKMKVDAKEIDLSKTKTTTKSEKREYEIIKDSDQRKGVLSTESYMCPKCDCTEVYFYLEQIYLFLHKKRYFLYPQILDY